MSIKILVCCHKKDVCVKQEPYLPIHVGHALHSEIDLDMQCDDEGENISLKNGSYCELTGMYWAWKNLKNVDVIGLTHYRRYFDFHKQVRFGLPEKQIKSAEFGKLNLDVPIQLINSLDKNTVVVAKPRCYPVDVCTNYCLNHYSTDIKKLRYIVERNCELKYLQAFNVVMHSCCLIHYNMFLMRWSQYEKYCEWLFNLLSIAERDINIDFYDATQKRIYGYFAERLFNVYLLANSLHVKKYPILWIFDGVYPQYSVFANVLRNVRNKIINLLQHPKNLFVKKL